MVGAYIYFLNSSITKFLNISLSICIKVERLRHPRESESHTHAFRGKYTLKLVILDLSERTENIALFMATMKRIFPHYAGFPKYCSLS